MASMREIKLRIKSIRETRQITKAMKLISAAKLKKSKQQLEQTEPYFKKVQEAMKDIILHSGDIGNMFFKRISTNTPRKGFIAITGDRGLAGGYNQNIIRLLENNLKDNPGSALYIIGNTGRNYFSKKNRVVDMEFDFSSQNPTVARARDIAEVVVRMFKKNRLDEVYLVYTHMVSSMLLEPRVLKLLPLDAEIFVKDPTSVKIDEKFTYEPSTEVVLSVLVPKYLKGIIYGAMVESFTSEQSARMTAMDNATKSADDLIQKLDLYYNRARQAAITKEISEIVGGVEALK